MPASVKSPQDFGFYRSRWTCGTVVALLKEDFGVRTSQETVRCWLHDEGLFEDSRSLAREGCDNTPDGDWLPFGNYTQ